MKKNRNNKLMLTAGLGIFLLSLMALTPKEVWKAPASAKKMLNPVKDIEKATKDGKKLFTNMCAICHGNKGHGDGVAGMALNPRPASLNTALVQDQTDGEIFWKITEGRPPMATYKEILTVHQRWQLVNYIRTFKK